MDTYQVVNGPISRRDILAGSAALLTGGSVGAGVAAMAAPAPAAAPPLPWKWVKLDPLEAGRRAYRYYKEKGGCGSASYLSLLSLLKVKAMSPLCHTSVSKWSLAAGVKDLHDQGKVERCAKVAGEVVYIVTTALNEFFEGKWVAPAWNPSPEIQHCIKCHGPDTAEQKARKWNQQGHMDCLMCHDDHTK